MSPEEGNLDQLLEYVSGFIDGSANEQLAPTKICPNLPKNYFGLTAHLGLGQTIPSAVPFFALLGNGQKPKDGIYPVFLFYKDFDLLILAYGISAASESVKEWEEPVKGKDTISTWFENNAKRFDQKKVKKLLNNGYGNSFFEHAIFNIKSNKAELPKLTENLETVICAYKNSLEFKSSNKKIEANAESKLPLNLILYGPPGTGKTYTTINKALEILNPEFLKVNSTNRLDLKNAFDSLVNNDRVRFVTFHQSFSYEDFVEGIRAKTDTSGAISYSVENGIFKDICVAADKAPMKPFVLIIDEINRGNISKIFGELITLIEPSKRKDESEVLQVTLPYSKKPFSVPNNVYLIGTMNTADRSLTGLDIALRRRFTFEEMPPRPELLDEVTVEKINIGNLLRRMNERIEVLLDREHCLGHAYFMELNNNSTINSLSSIFRQKIIPLLQEYFFEDWERISWVLNDQHSNGEKFLIKPNSNLIDLFGPDVGLQDRRWHINEKAFATAASYKNI